VEIGGCMAKSAVDNDQLRKIRDDLAAMSPHIKVRAHHIQAVILKEYNYKMDESTIRGRFTDMGEPLSGNTASKPSKPQVQVEPSETLVREANVIAEEVFDVPDGLKKFIPPSENFENYIERGIDKRLALHYDSGKHPLTQGKQGTGKTFSHEYYAYKKQLPFFLLSCHPDFKLEKQFGDKTIENGSIVFRESLFVEAFQNPSVICIDEVNAIDNKESFPFHAMLQNGELYIKDANDGKGKIYRKHPDCRIGFAQNPKSAKYLGGNVKPSNFLGRCTFITYPEFTRDDIKKAITKKFTALKKEEVTKFTQFYFAALKAIDKGQIPVDISIRQLNSVIELYLAGLPLRESIEDGMSSIMEAASQPTNKEVFWRLAQGIWKELMDETACDKISKDKGFSSLLRRLWL
jgi:MoxR-like ATPase